MSRPSPIETLLANATPQARAFLSAPGETIPISTLDDELEPSVPLDAGAPAQGLHALTMLGTLGTGGMSVVRLANQEPIGRDVAVKTLREDARTPKLARRLLQEAFVTGHLEHPNIVPLHDLRIDETGVPQVVLKRIEGTAWDEVLADPSRRPDASEGVEPLVWHLRVLVAVCRAIEFAHARGIVHRDIKPANVMIGRFSEVTLLDWGLAICVDPDGPARLPRWSPWDGIVGTPAYMAPEMLEVGRPPTPATDVYLLGSCLAHILTGRAPHGGADLADMIRGIRASFGPGTGPTPLRALCAAAMAPDPDDRPGSAAMVRRALERYLEDRSFDDLADAAVSRLARLRAAVDASDPESVPTLLAACRFGFGEVLARRPDHAVARAGFDEALHLAARAALAQGQPSVALRTLSEARAPDPDLLEAARAAEAQNERAVARAGDILAEHAPESGRRARVLLAAAVWMGMGVVPMAFIDLERLRPLPVPAIVFVMLAGLGGAALVLLRPRLVPNRPVRVFVVLLALMPPMQGLAELGLRLRDIGPDIAFSMPLLIGTVYALVGALLVDRRLLTASVSYAALWLAASGGLLPAPHAVGLGNGVLGLCCAWVFLSAHLLPAGSDAA